MFERLMFERLMTATLKASIAAVSVLLAASAANANPYLVTIQQSGADVVATGGGQIDLTGLTNIGITVFIGGETQPSTAFIGFSTGTGDAYSGFSSGPKNFGPGGTPASASGSSGPQGGISGFEGDLFVPAGYILINDSVLAQSTDTFSNTTIAGLGMKPGTYVWKWGNQAPDQSYTIDIIGAATPIPAALPLFASGLGGLGLFGWRRKRKAHALA
jgi:hypothetical protein